MKKWLQRHEKDAVNAQVRPWLIHRAMLAVTIEDAGLVAAHEQSRSASADTTSNVAVVVRVEASLTSFFFDPISMLPSFAYLMGAPPFSTNVP